VLAGRRVLVAEDEPAILDMLERFLVEEGAAVTGVRDGQEAWEQLAKGDFDLVLADLRMPRLDGRGLYDRIARHRPELLPRVVCSPPGRPAPGDPGFSWRTCRT
jgi:CheY-like chemotaxis protein